MRRLTSSPMFRAVLHVGNDCLEGGSRSDGGVLEQGTHESLMADTDGHYHRSVTLQSAAATG